MTETITWLAALLLLPHPLTQRLANAAASRMLFEILRHFMPAASPTFALSAVVPLALPC